MNVLALAIMAFWLMLLTLAFVGLNVRMALMRKEMSHVAANSPVSQASGSAPGYSQHLAQRVPMLRNAAVLVVDETCLGCSAAIDALEQVAVAAAIRNGGGHGSERGVARYVVLSPDPDELRLAGRAHLRLLVDPEAYRRLYPGLTPSLLVTDDSAQPVVVRPAATEESIREVLDDALGEFARRDVNLAEEGPIGQGGRR